MVFVITDMIPIEDLIARNHLFLLLEYLLIFRINLTLNFLHKVVWLLVSFHAQFLLLLATIKHFLKYLLFSFWFCLFDTFIFAVTSLEGRGRSLCSNLWRHFDDRAETLRFWLSTETREIWEAAKLGIAWRWHLDSDEFGVYFRLRIYEAARKVKIRINWEFWCSLPKGISERILALSCLKWILCSKTATKALHLRSRLLIILNFLHKCLGFLLFKWFLNHGCKLRPLIWIIFLISNGGLNCTFPALFLTWSSHLSKWIFLILNE